MLCFKSRIHFGWYIWCKRLSQELCLFCLWLLLLQHPFVEKTIFPSLNWFWIVKSQLSIAVWIYSSGFCSFVLGFFFFPLIYMSITPQYVYVYVLIRSVLSTLCNPLVCSLSSSVLGILQGKNTGVHCHLLLQRTSRPEDQTWSLLHHRHILLPSEPQERPYSSTKQSKQPKKLHHSFDDFSYVVSLDTGQRFSYFISLSRWF